MKKIKEIIKKIPPYLFVLAIGLLFLVSSWQWWLLKHHAVPSQVAEDRILIQNIESYLDKIGPSFTDDVQLLAKENNVPSWGCGPSSYALAAIIDRRFFDNKIPISASYDNNPYEIVERFGFVEFNQNGKKIIGDHAWIEIYTHSQMIFIDPTIGQYGKVKGIAYETFRVGDPYLKQTLKDKYNIIDNRISKLVQKALDKIPINDEPYPGFAIDPAFMSYYLDILELRNTVNIGHEPEKWKPWVAAFMDKYH